MNLCVPLILSLQQYWGVLESKPKGDLVGKITWLSGFHLGHIIHNCVTFKTKMDAKLNILSTHTL